MNYFKKIIATILVAATALSFTACSNPKWAFKSGDDEITSGVYIAYTIASYLNMYNHEDFNQEQTNIFKQKLDDKDAKTWIIDESQKASKNHLTIARKFDELNLKFDEKDINIINNQVDSAWEQIGEIYEKNGVSKKSYYNVIENQRKNELIFMSIYGKGGKEEITDENLLVHFKENFADINVIAMPLKTGETLSDNDKKANEELKTKAEEYVKKVNEGTAFNVVRDEYDHYSKKTDHKDDEEHKSTIKEDKETKTLVSKKSTQPSEKVVASIFEAKTDEATLLADDKAYYLVYRYDVTKDEKQFDEMRDGLLYDIKGEDYQKMLDKWNEETSLETNQAAIKKFNPKNIKAE